MYLPTATSLILLLALSFLAAESAPAAPPTATLITLFPKATLVTPHPKAVPTPKPKPHQPRPHRRPDEGFPATQRVVSIFMGDPTPRPRISTRPKATLVTPHPKSTPHLKSTPKPKATPKPKSTSHPKATPTVAEPHKPRPHRRPDEGMPTPPPVVIVPMSGGMRFGSGPGQ